MNADAIPNLPFTCPSSTSSFPSPPRLAFPAELLRELVLCLSLRRLPPIGICSALDPWLAIQWRKRIILNKNEVHVQLKSIRDEATTLLNGTLTRLNGTLTRLNGISDALFSATTIEEVHDLRSQLNSIQIHPPVADPSALQSSTAHFAPPIRQSSTTCVTHTLPHFAVIFRLSMEADGSYTLTWICRRIPVSSLCFCLDYTLGLYKLDGPMSLRSVAKKVVIITSAWSNSTAQNMENAVHGVGTRPRVHFPANRLNNLCTIWPPEKRGYPSGWKPPVLVDACGPDQESVTFFLRTRMYCAVKNKEKSLYFAVRMPIATN